MACLQFSLPLYSFLALAIVFGSSHHGVQGATWDYSDGTHGPLHWSSSYPKCAGSSQSPIAVSSNTAVKESTSDRFCFEGYEEERNMNIKNNGHSVQVTLASNSYFIKGGGLSGQYQAQQFHFHWGSDCSKGSEHSVDGVYYPAEMHIVHRKVGLTDDEALQVNDGLAVLSVMIKIGDTPNENFAAIIESLSDIPNSGDETTTSEDFSLDDLLPGNRREFFRYYGSLTTPTCDESVVWTVFANHVEISENQIAAFRALYFDQAGSKQMVDNFRPIQALNGRTVKRYYVDPSADSSSNCDEADDDK